MAKEINFVLESDTGDDWITEAETTELNEARIDFEFCWARDSSNGESLSYRIRRLVDNEIVWTDR